jgi:hypothetical protein
MQLLGESHKGPQMANSELQGNGHRKPPTGGPEPASLISRANDRLRQKRLTANSRSPRCSTPSASCAPRNLGQGQ